MLGRRREAGVRPAGDVEYERRQLRVELPASALARLGGTSTAVVSDVLGAFGDHGHHLRGLRSVASGAGVRLVGRAVTLGYEPARRCAGRTAYLANEVLPRLQPGDVPVMATGDARHSFWGDQMVRRAMQRQVAGAVLDGGIRDHDAIRELGFPIFAADLTPHSYLGHMHAVSYNEPVRCAGVEVLPGDVVVADADGVVAVPRPLIGLVERAIGEMESLERWVEEAMVGGVAADRIHAEVDARKHAISDLGSGEAARTRRARSGRALAGRSPLSAILSTAVERAEERIRGRRR